MDNFIEFLLEKEFANYSSNKSMFTTQLLIEICIRVIEKVNRIKPLNKTQIDSLWVDITEEAIKTGESVNQVFARRIELAHGIGKTKNEF